MSRERYIKVVRASYTPRDRLQAGRFNLVLGFEAEVPLNSYLFIGGSEISYAKAKFVRGNAIKAADGIVSAVKTGRIDQRYFLDNLLRRYELIGGLKQTTSNVKVANEVIIPASSLRGAIRSRLEYKFVVKDNESYSCYSVISPTFDFNYAKRHMNFWGKDVVVEKRTCNFEESQNVCKVCDIFGTSGLSSRVEFLDAKLTTKVNLASINVFGVNYGVIPSNTKFTFDVACKNFNMEDLGLLFTAMEIYTNSPIIIGRFKYRYNPKVGGDIDGKYFGLLKIKPTGIRYAYPKLDKDLPFIIEDSRKSIEHYIRDGYLDLSKGAI